MAPAGKPISPIMTGRSFRRHVEVFDLDSSGQAAAKAWGGTVNDVFVTSVIRGLALYHEQHGVVSPGFRALMPVNVRTQRDPKSGNHFVPARFVDPAHADVADCVAEVRRVAEEWKNAPGLAMSDVLATGLSALPAAVARGLWGSMLLGNDVCVTNIPGPPFPATLAGVGVRASSPCRRRRGPHSTCPWSPRRTGLHHRHRRRGGRPGRPEARRLHRGRLRGGLLGPPPDAPRSP